MRKMFVLVAFLATLSAVRAEGPGFFGRLEGSMALCPLVMQVEGPGGFKVSPNPWFVLPAIEGSASAGFKAGPFAAAIGASFTGAMAMIYLSPVATLELGAGKWIWSAHLAGSNQRYAQALSPLPFVFFPSYPSPGGLVADLCLEYQLTEPARLYGSLFCNRQETYDGADHVASIYALIGVRLLQDWSR